MISLCKTLVFFENNSCRIDRCYSCSKESDSFKKIYKTFKIVPSSGNLTYRETSEEISKIKSNFSNNPRKLSDSITVIDIVKSIQRKIEKAENNKNKYNSIQEDIFINKLDVKIYQLINKVVNDRKFSINIIVKNIRIYLHKIKEKTKLLKNKILLLRKLKITLIQSYFRSYWVRKDVKDILKNYDYVFIYRNINLRKIRCEKANYNHPLKYNNINHSTNKIDEMKFKLYKGDEYVLKFSKTLNTYYFPFKKKLTLRKRFLVNFIVNNKIIINPNYEVYNDKNGNFYNIIDSSMFRKKSNINSEMIIKNTKFWENIFKIKVRTSRPASEASDQSNDTTNENLLSNITSTMCRMKIIERKLKPILKNSSGQTMGVNSSKCVKRVAFNDEIQFYY